MVSWMDGASYWQSYCIAYFGYLGFHLLKSIIYSEGGRLDRNMDVVQGTTNSTALAISRRNTSQISSQLSFLFILPSFEQVSLTSHYPKTIINPTSR